MRINHGVRYLLLACLVLAVLAPLGVMALGGTPKTRPGATARSMEPVDPSGSSTGTPASKDALVNPAGLYFGIATPQAPSQDRTDAVAKAAGSRPTVQEYFLKWNQDFDLGAAQQSYQMGALPLITWEPWSGGDQNADQPQYSLQKIASGAMDDYVRHFAQGVRQLGQPVVLRFAHEMNESWYQWSEDRNGNKKGDYIAAWQHVHDVFQRQGATNVIWFWCPDLRQSSNKPPLSRYYPGDAYVDWIGMDAYSSEGEQTAGSVLDSTFNELTALSSKPIFIGEVGAKPTDVKALWTQDFFEWLLAHPRVIGFCWFQFSDDDGGRYDWRFTTSPGAQGAFHDGLESQNLVSWPVH